MTASEWEVASSVLRLGAQVVDGVQDGMARRGFDDVRPVHGFAFAVLSAGPVTANDLAVALGVTKQSAAQVVDHLVEHGYVTREPDPRDGRARLLVMTARGHACTAAAEQAAAEVVAAWRGQLSGRGFAELARGVTTLAGDGRLRPSW